MHPTCGPTQQDDIPGKVRYLTYKELEKEISNERRGITYSFISHLPFTSTFCTWEIQCLY